MKNCLVQKLCGFKEGKIWRMSIICMYRGISKFHLFFFIINRKNIKFQVKKYQATLILTLMVNKIFYDNLSRGYIPLIEHVYLCEKKIK